jgi:hypothetical protein
LICLKSWKVFSKEEYIELKEGLATIASEENSFYIKEKA